MNRVNYKNLLSRPLSPMNNEQTMKQNLKQRNKSANITTGIVGGPSALRLRLEELLVITKLTMFANQ